MNRRYKFIIIFIVNLVVFVSLVIFFHYYLISRESNSNYQEENFDIEKSGILLSEGLELPLCNENNQDHQIQNFKYYSICYRESYEDAEWSAYRLTSEQLEKKSYRTNNFRIDPLIITGSSTLADYKGSGFDKGHLTPAADMSFCDEAMSETFYMSNMTPQAPAFNRDIWMHLEKQVREWCAQYGRIYVVTGPILEKTASEYETIGENKVVIPEFFYKTILAPIYKDSIDLETPEDSFAVIAIGFIIPNEGCSNDYWDYAVSIDEIERRTGLDFYFLLDNEIEDIVECQFNLDFWK